VPIPSFNTTEKVPNIRVSAGAPDKGDQTHLLFPSWVVTPHFVRGIGHSGPSFHCFWGLGEVRPLHSLHVA
jgi:hypothetical protein